MRNDYNIDSVYMDTTDDKRNDLDTVEVKEDYSKIKLSNIQNLINSYKSENSNNSVGSLSDGYHTFDELYHHRSMLFLALCLTAFKDKAWKSLLHEEGGDPMYNGMFIMGVETPYGQATYHYDIDPYWEKAKNVKEVYHAPKFDGHTPNDAIDRILKYAVDISSKFSNTVYRETDPWNTIPIVPCSGSGLTTTNRSTTTDYYSDIHTVNDMKVDPILE